MSDIIKDSVTGEYHYKTDYNYPRYSNSRWNPNIIQYYHDLYSIRNLPQSPMENLNQIKTDRGYFDLNEKLCHSIFSEQNIICKRNNTPREKAWPTRIEIKDENGISVPHYFRTFNMSYGIDEEVDKIISNVICGRLFPTSMPYYIGKYNNQFGTVGIDLNHLNDVKSLRLDHYLESKGVKLDSIVSLLHAYNTGIFKDELTDSAITQLMFSMFTIPNAIGELDPNTRNAILLGPNQKDAKFDSIVRIDFEKNEINQPNNNTYSLGIFHRDEYKHEFKENIIKALTDRVITPADVNMMLALNQVTKYATASRSNIDKALTNATTAHEPHTDNHIITKGHFTNHKLTQFAEDLRKHANQHADHFEQYFHEASAKTGTTFYANYEQLPSLER